MPTIIDSLIVALSLDDAKFRSGSKGAREDLKRTKDAAEETGKTFELQAKKSIEGFAKLRNEIIGLFAVFTGGAALEKFVQQTIQTDAATGRLAHNLDMSTESLSAWQGVLKRNGGAAEDANQGLQTLADGFQQIQLTGQSPLIPYLNLLKVSLKDLNDPSETLLKIADAFQKMDPRQATAIGKGMGLSPALISTLEKGRAAVQGMLDDQKKIGVITDADAEAAQKLQNTLSSLHQAFTSIGRTVLTVFAPALDVIAKGLTLLGELAQKNKPIMVGLLLGIATAAAIASVPMLALAADVLITIAPFLALGVAIGGVVEVVMAVVQWFANLLKSNQQTREAMAELGAAAGELWQSLKDAFAPLKPVFDAIWNAVKMIGAAIADAFGGASLAVARTFITYLTNQFHALSDIIRAVTALLHGDLKGALSAAGDYAKDAFADPTASAARRSSAASAAQSGGQAAANGNAAPSSAGRSASQAAANMIAGFEGFIDHAKWDRNAFRLGFGSDTTTDPRTGKVSRVTPGSTVDRASATADLNRRIQTEFMPKVAAAIGGAWSKFNTTTKAALTSIAYNYGHLPASVLRAARSGDTAAIAAAIKARATDNDGVNRNRRLAEAAAVTGAGLAANSNLPVGVRGAAVGARAQYAGVAGSTTTTNSTQIGEIKIYPPNGDADSIATSIGPAIKQRSYATQANTGLS